MSAYFLFMARETGPIDMTSCIPEVVDVRSNVLIDFLVVLARVVDVVSPSSPLEGLSIMKMLFGETAFAQAVIGSWHSRSAIQAC